jgi:hypothetical protein
MVGTRMTDRRTRYWYRVEDTKAYVPRTVVWIHGRGYHEVLVCGIHEVLVRRLSRSEVIERQWQGRLLRWWRKHWPFGRG